MNFTPHSPAEERLPVITRDAVGREIEMRDQVGTMRLLPDDRVSLVEHRDNYALCEHVACKSGLLLIKLTALTQKEEAS